MPAGGTTFESDRYSCRRYLARFSFEAVLFNIRQSSSVFVWTEKCSLWRYDADDSRTTHNKAWYCEFVVSYAGSAPLNTSDQYSPGLAGASGCSRKRRNPTWILHVSMSSIYCLFGLGDAIIGGDSSQCCRVSRPWISDFSDVRSGKANTFCAAERCTYLCKVGETCWNGLQKPRNVSNSIKVIEYCSLPVVFFALVYTKSSRLNYVT